MTCTWYNTSFVLLLLLLYSSMLVYVYVKHCFFFGMVFQLPRVFSCSFGCAASEGGVGTLQCMCGSRLSPVAVMWAFNVARAGSFCQGIVFRLAEKIRCVENPTFFFVLLKNSPFRSHILLFVTLSRPLCNISGPIICTLSAVRNGGATYSQQQRQQQQQHIPRTSSVAVARSPVLYCCTPHTEHVSHAA